MELKVSCFIMVFFATILTAFAQCPTVSNSSPPAICDAAGYTFSDLNTFAIDNGGGILWYDSPTGGNFFNNNQLVAEGTYYADSSTGNCGTRQPITINFVVAATNQNLEGIYCSNENATIQTYINDELQSNAPVGGSVEVYYDLQLSMQANGTDVLQDGGTNYFIVFVDASNCRSQIEGGTTAVFDAPDDPTPLAIQEFCSNTNPTIADLDPGTTSAFNWYLNVDANGDGIPPALNSSTALINGVTYYVQAQDFFCESNAAPVTVIISDPFEAGNDGALDFCQTDISSPQFEDLFPQLGNTADTNGVWSGPIATTNGNTGTVDVSLLPIGASVFTYTVPANGACPEDSATVTITIYETFTSGTVSVNNPATFCEASLPTSFDLETLLDNEDPNGQWTDNTNAIITNPIDLTGTTPGTYNFTYTQNVAPNPCPEESTTVQVVILQDPDAGMAINAVFCENDLATNSPYNLFDALDGSQDNNNGVWTDDTNTVVSNPIDITSLTVANSPYQFTYTIDNGTCSDSEVITITVEEAPESGTPIATFPEFCEGEAPAALDLFDLLDNEDQIGTWYSGTDNTGTAITNPIDASLLTPGTYSYTFDVDAIGSCDDELVTVEITINPLPNTGTPTPATFCENDLTANSPLDLFGQLSGNDAGGTWTDDDTTGALTGSNVDLTLLTIGVYNFTYTITDPNGCTNNSTVIVTVEEAPESGTPIATFPEFCEGEAPAALDLFDLLDNEDQIGTWYSGTDNTGTAITNPIDASLLTPGTYSYTFDVDAIGSCDDELVTVEITINPLPNTGTPTPATFCENDLTANSPLDLFGQLSGNDAGGTWTDDDTTGALTGSNVDLTLLTIGVYNFTYAITDSNGCTNSSTVTVTVEDAPVAGTVSESPEFCVSDIVSGQTIDLFDYLNGEDQPGVWSDNTPSNQLSGSILTLDGLAPGAYTFTYDVDAIGSCDDPNMPTVTITINDTPAPTAMATQDFCDAATVADLSATGTSILWYNEATGGNALDAATPLQDGETYYASQTDATTGCESSVRVEVTVSIIPLPNSGGLATNPIIVCNDTTVDLNTGLDGTQDTTGTWTDSSGTVITTPSMYDVTGFTPGDYIFTYTVSAAPCADAVTSITVSIQEPLSSGTSNGDLAFCSTDGTFDLFTNITGEDIGGEWIYNGNSVSNIFDPAVNESGTYIYFIANSCGNSSTSFEVSVSQAPNAGTNGTFTICAADVDTSNNILDLLSVLNDIPDASGTFTNDDSANGFSGNNLDLSLVTPGTYNFTYTVIATAPCTVNSNAIATVTVNDTGAVTIVNASPAFCAVDDAVVSDLDTAVNGTNITWYAEENDSTPLDASEALIDGEDYFAVQNNTTNGCESSTRVQVVVSINDAPTPTLLNSDLELCINDAPTIAELTANITEYNSASNNVVWYDAPTGGNVVTASTNLEVNTTYYAVLIDSTSGCESSIRLDVSPDLTGCGLLVIPDGFSPNNDGVNDTFNIENLDIIYPNFEIEIYNRYGNVVYKGNASTPAFNGKSNQSRLIGGGELPVGVYFYIFNFNDGVNKPQQGTLYLSR